MNNEVLEELLDNREAKLRQELKDFVNDRIITAMYQSQKPQPRATGEEVVFWNKVLEIFAEEAEDSPTRLWNFVAQWAKDKGVPRANEIYQHGGNYIKRY